MIVYDNLIRILALNEFAAFDEAIGKALSMINLEETLVLVTADHRKKIKILINEIQNNLIFNKIFLKFC